MRFFFYGTLLDADVRESVLGERYENLTRGTMIGFVRLHRAGAAYPILVPRTGSSVDGIITGVLGPAQIERLDAYEGAEYERRLMTVRTVDGDQVACFVYVPVPGVDSDGRPWTLEGWRARR